MNKHTQGPWMWVKKDDYWNLETADGEMIADDGSSCGEYGGWFGSEWPNANARLIAAAPDLLAALQEVLAHTPEPHAGDARAILHRARAAIAKATGGQP